MSCESGASYDHWHKQEEYIWDELSSAGFGAYSGGKIVSVKEREG